MRIFLIFGLILGACQLDAKSLVRIYSPSSHLKDLDIAGASFGKWIDVVATPEELSIIKAKALNYKVLAPDIEELERSVKGDYHNYNDFVAELTALAINYPEIAKLDTLGTSYEGRPILSLKISDNVGIDEDEPELLFLGLHHAREWPTLEICLFYADTLVKGYEFDFESLVDSREIWIVPCVNPDGYVYCHDQGHDWRKNRHYFPEFGTYGVDLNRNYDGSCDGNPRGEWGSIGDGAQSHGPSTSVYCGESAFSEAETQAIREIVLAHNFVFCVSYHTYGEMVMWPWGYTLDPAPCWDLLSQIGINMAGLIGRQGGGTYDAHQSCGLYPTTGTTDDWLYGYELYLNGRNSLGYTVEACSSFAPPAAGLEQVVKENFDGALYLCEIADSISSLLVPRVKTPVIEKMDSSFGNYIINWSNEGATKYWLQELKGLSIYEDSAETGSSLWELDGFNLSTARAHSESHSYFAGSGDTLVTSMTSKYPVPRADSLTFWCWYNTENNYDYAFVEVSKTGREWEILDSFNGSSDGWVRKAYLVHYKSFFIRFRYTTDDWYSYEGFYVDDIKPVSSFDLITTLSNNIQDTFYTVAHKLPDTYWYWVKGYNLKGWADFGEPEEIEVKEFKDVGVDTIILPPDTVFTDSIHTPSARIKNYGNLESIFKTFCEIRGYGDSLEIALLPWKDTLVNFLPWVVPAEPDTYCMKVYTSLSDMDLSNNQLTRVITSIKSGVSELEKDEICPYLTISSNPVSKDTRILYGLPEARKISLKVYDVTGRLISSLLDRHESAGEHQFLWSQMLPAGIYFLVLDSSDFRKSLKIILLH
ncbi:immune inhibitor A [candidate division WOR-3 bacterium]|nr:immune inhibitor A [candidate division WOR-3 bacterium]